MGESHQGPDRASVFVRAAGVLTVGLLAMTVSPPAAGAAGISASQRAQAKASFLVKSDLPNGWKSAKNTISGSAAGLGSGNAAVDQQLSSCTGMPLSLIQENPPNVLGPEFDSSGNQSDSVGQQVVIFRSAAAARSFESAVGNAKLPTCMQTLAQGPLGSKLLGSVPHGVTIGTMTVSAPPSASLPAHAAGITIEFPLTEQGVTLKVTATEVLTIKGNRAQELSFDGGGEPFPAGLEKHLVAVATSRL
jgi:hypothetical protein